MNVVDDRLQHGAGAPFAPQQAGLLGLALVVLEHKGQRREHDRLDDAKGPVGPAPAGPVDKGLAGQRGGKCGTDEWRLGKGEGEGSVPQPGGIGDEDVEDVVEGLVADPEDRVTGGVRIRVVTGGSDDKPEGVDAEEDEEALGTTPEVENLGDGQAEHTPDDGV